LLGFFRKLPPEDRTVWYAPVEPVHRATDATQLGSVAMNGQQLRWNDLRASEGIKPQWSDQWGERVDPEQLLEVPAIDARQGK